MTDQTPQRARRSRNRTENGTDAYVLTRRIVSLANQGIPRVDFMREVSDLLLDHCKCDRVETLLLEGSKCYRSRLRQDSERSFQYEPVVCFLEDASLDPDLEESLRGIDRLAREVMLGNVDIDSPYFTRRGSFFTGDLTSALTKLNLDGEDRRKASERSFEDVKSLAIIPLVFIRDNIGLLLLGSSKPDFFARDDIMLYQALARDLGFALVNQHAQAALRERVKEQTCLYGIAQLAATPEITLSDILKGTVELLPPGWQYPEITSGRILFDEEVYTSTGYSGGVDQQTADIMVNGRKRGTVEVVYSRTMPELAEGPFLKEERSLIDTIAKEIALIVEQKQAEEERARLRNQLIHADRLATLGQLAAGVAHELNEPLGNILGFAQLAEKHENIPNEVVEDIEKIVKASLHAREVVKKLLLFARQMPPRKQPVNLNDLVANGLYFLEARCSKANIRLVRDLSPDLPLLVGDSSQLHQVLVNLVVNAIQAMADGGRLTIRTQADDRMVKLIVEDTGVGINEDVIKKIFLPFFTTKDVQEGTGLGLAVVHGIVTAHGGSIDVQSKRGEGSRFEVRLPISEDENEVKEDTQDGGIG